MRRLKQAANLAGVPILIIEVHVANGMQLEHVGSDLYVVRPNRPADIAELIACLMRKKNEGRERPTSDRRNGTSEQLDN